MARNIVLRILAIVGSLLVLVGVVLAGAELFREKNENVIEMDLSEGETETVKFEDLSLVPGEECKYSIKLGKHGGANKYDLFFDFVETKEGTLKQFVRVKLLADGKEVCDELLADIYNKEDIFIPVDLKKKENTDIKIVYYMPLEVGNEAKNAEAKFELRLTASNE